jgi:hypothetical protein
MTRSMVLENRSRPIVGLLSIAGLLIIVWALANWIVTGSFGMLIMGSMAIALAMIVVTTLNNWRVGVLLFILWLLFEDLSRKYLGNGLLLFFGKDILALITYLSLWRARKRGEVPWFRPPFIVPLALFFFLAFIQVFNTWTPSVLYGFLGLKLYFYYFPLIYAGYALIRNERDLEQLLVYNLAFGLLIGVLGIIQSIVGLKFLSIGVLFRLPHLTRSPRAVPRAVHLSKLRTATAYAGGV